ncbi:AraC family transcriptional regulator [Rhizobium leguminosarum bv. viciae]|nr:AraC family transcriptional regulator [Rhizobium leguminosarum bv. viciae]
MSETGAYGRQLASRFNLEEVPTIVSRAIRKANLAVTEIHSEADRRELSKPVPYEDAFLITLLMRDFPNHQCWEDDRPAAARNLAAGDIIFYDLKRQPYVLTDGPHHSVHFYLPRPVLDQVADDAEALRIGDLAYRAGAPVSDETMKHMILAMRHAFSRPKQIGRLFVDQMALAMATHVAENYGGLRPECRPIRGGLAPWQERRAKELLSSGIGGSLSISELARECSLSQRHFCRAFRHSTGLSPHAWLQKNRIEKAKSLLCLKGSTLTEIALACGFADQSHFTRVFTQLAGVSPGAWRRAACSSVT